MSLNSPIVAPTMETPVAAVAAAAVAKRPVSDLQDDDSATAPFEKKLKTGDGDWTDDDEDAWMHMFEQLQQRINHGDCLVPDGGYSVEDPVFDNWVCQQRQLKAAGKLSEGRVEKLNSIGFVWKKLRSSSRPADVFETKCERLLAYIEEYGHGDVPYRFEIRSSNLGRWVYNQRKLRKLGKLTDDQVEKLDQIGFVWIPQGKVSPADAFEAMLDRLKEYKNQTGHTKVPSDYKDDPKLGRWVDTQRRKKKRGKLLPERTEKLESVGFVWSVRESNENRFEDMVQRLEQYRQQQGHCKVPVSYKEDPQLGRWVDTKRQQKKKGKLLPEHETRLDSMGFVWVATPVAGGSSSSGTGNKNEAFETMLDQLEAFKQEFGHVKVTASRDKKLAKWVSRQRELKKAGKLLPERVTKLDSIGFIWSCPKPESFETMCERLEAFHQETGHANVPKTYPEDPKLAKWVKNQRRYKQEGRLLPERIEKLESMGFEWSSSSSAEAPPKTTEGPPPRQTRQRKPRKAKTDASHCEV